ncbi:hypothetical protein Bhyg_03364 [Pseudolycoriella hygida]|uniref:Regulatory protein zeste n=1 Tax=Pseudolycoriella hygida TaxID=35572 RepID=A0A9Q0NEW9_9DIPT|nr:hypothetical protein Bhyg_03364 [Pseudolycoriella hygida]
MLKIKEKRNPRMLSKQKEELVRLIQTHFLRTTGRCYNVNDKDIDEETWKQIAARLNELGPSKTYNEWKTSFHYMKSRVKTKLDSLVKRCVQSGQSFNLNDMNSLDGIFVQMFYVTTLGVEQESEKENIYETPSERPEDESNIGDNGENSSEHNVTFAGTSNDGMISEQFAEDVVATNDHLWESTNEFFSYDPVEEPIVIPSTTNNEIRVVQSESKYDSGVNELEEFSYDPHVTEQSHPEEQLHNSSEVPTRRILSNERIAEGRINVTRRVQGLQAMRGRRTLRGRRAMRGRQVMRGRQAMRAGRVLNGGRTMRRGRVTNGLRAPMTCKRGQRKGTGVRKIIRVSIAQKRRLLMLVEQNFLRTVGRFPGFHGVAIKRRIWEDYAKELNSLGPPFKNGKGWENTFTCIRLRAKNNVACLRNDINKKRGIVTKLSESDEKILTMYGIDLLDGIQGLSEGGLLYEKTLPFQTLGSNSASTVVSDRPNLSTNQSDNVYQNSEERDYVAELITFGTPIVHESDASEANCDTREVSQNSQVSRFKNGSILHLERRMTQRTGNPASQCPESRCENRPVNGTEIRTNSVAPNARVGTSETHRDSQEVVQNSRGNISENSSTQRLASRTLQRSENGSSGHENSSGNHADSSSQDRRQNREQNEVSGERRNRRYRNVSIFSI